MKGMSERGPVYRWKRCPVTGGSVLRLMPVVVYGYFTPDGACLYVGQSTNPTDREYMHRAKSPWFAEDLEWRELGLYLKRGDALIAEARAIRELAPAHNIRHNRKAAA